MLGLPQGYAGWTNLTVSANFTVTFFLALSRTCNPLICSCISPVGVACVLALEIGIAGPKVKLFPESKEVAGHESVADSKTHAVNPLWPLHALFWKTASMFLTLHVLGQKMMDWPELHGHKVPNLAIWVSARPTLLASVGIFSAHGPRGEDSDHWLETLQVCVDIPLKLQKHGVVGKKIIRTNIHCGLIFMAPLCSVSITLPSLRDRDFYFYSSSIPHGQVLVQLFTAEAFWFEELRAKGASNRFVSLDFVD